MLLDILFEKQLARLTSSVHQRVSISLIKLNQAINKANDSINQANITSLKSLQSVKEAEEQLNELNKKYTETLDEYAETLKLQKLYVYLIPKLINSSGIIIPEDFDITNYDDAEKLYNRYYNGDLMYD